MHHKNIQSLATKMFKVKHKLCPEITSDIFMERKKNRYNLRNRPDFIPPQVHSVFHGTESILVFHILDVGCGILFQKNLT